MKNRENQFIMELCKFLEPDSDRICSLMAQPLDYPYILGQLLMHRMGAAAYYTLRKCGLLSGVGREFRNSLKAMYDVGIAKTDSLIQCMAEMQHLFAGLPFPYALLKGAYLASVYPKGLRTSNDLDMLVSQKNLSELTEALRNAGFLQGKVKNGRFIEASRAEIISSRMNRGETVPFLRPVLLPQMEYLELDINFSLDYKPSGNQDAVDQLLSHAEPRIAGGIMTLGAADFLIHLCVHLYKEATVMKWVEMGRNSSLYKFCDLYLYLNEYQEPSFYQDLKKRIREVGMEKECFYAFTYAKELFDIQLPQLDDLLDSVRPNQTEYLKQVYNPQAKKKYGFDADCLNWVFCSQPKEMLYEIRNDA